MMDISSHGGRSRDFAEAGGADRTRLMRRARIHSRFVRSLRVVLPATAVISLVLYGVALKLALPPKVKGLDPGRIKISTENLTMENPKYDGFNADGGKYFVTSKTATQDIRQKGPVQLETISGTLTQPDKTLTDLTATRGTFDTKKNELELYDGIDVVSQSGMRAKLSRATILTKESIITSREPVKVDMPTGQVTSSELEIYQKKRQVAFIGNVVTRLVPETKPGKETAAPAPQGQNRTVGASGGPVIINSQRLDIDDLGKVALFSGGVNAVQGQATLESQELEAYYEGQPIAQGGPAPAPGEPKQVKSDGQDAASKLSRLVVRKPLVLTNAADRVTGNAGEFDVKGDIATVLGDVVITSGPDRKATSDRAEIHQREDTVLLTGSLVHVIQGKNELKGRRLWVDRKAGRSLLTSPAEGGKGAGRIAARFYQNQTETKPGAAPKKAAAQADGEQSLAMGNFKTDPTAPIDIESESLDVNDIKKQAVFRGEVNAVQGEFKVKTSEMTAFYTGQAGLTSTPKDAPKTPADPSAKAGAQLSKIEARKGVIVTSKDGQKATGEWADFDVKANTVVMGGKEVILTQGQNIVRGTKLLIDLTTGESRVITSATPGVAAAPGVDSEAAGAGPFTPGTTGRARAVFHPQQGKDAHKKAKDEGKSPAEAAAAAAAAATGGAWQITDKPGAPKKPDPAASSSWDPASAFPGAGRN